MWTPETRAEHDRDELRYPSDLTDAEWRKYRIDCRSAQVEHLRSISLRRKREKCCH
jgi:hypothetical protein